MTIPTQLTLLRLSLTFLIVGFLFMPGWLAKVVAFVTFLIASFTDWLDGYLARRWQQKTALGILLDPIADKILVLSVLFVFVLLNLAPLWMVVVIAIREILITGIRLWAATRAVVLPADREGKLKMVFQVLTILVLFLQLIIQQAVGLASMTTVLTVLGQLSLICLSVSMILTLVSGIRFIGSLAVRLGEAKSFNSSVDKSDPSR